MITAEFREQARALHPGCDEPDCPNCTTKQNQITVALMRAYADGYEAGYGPRECEYSEHIHAEANRIERGENN